MRKTTGQIIKDLRKNAHLTQEQLGEILGVQKSIISKYERDDVVNLKRETIKKLADYFKVRPSYILGLTDEPIELSEEEKEMVVKFRNADDTVKEAIYVLLGIYKQKKKDDQLI